MPSIFHTLWSEVLRPFLQRPKRLQMAALCHRGAAHDTEVLLVTSRGSGRWIIPKGWPIRGLQASETALQEAWEEAGVRRATADNRSIGSYCYRKQLSSGLKIPVETMVYSVAVEDMSDTFPESDQRERQWVSPKRAADLVHETQLKYILRAF